MSHTYNPIQPHVEPPQYPAVPANGPVYPPLDDGYVRHVQQLKNLYAAGLTSHEQAAAQLKAVTMAQMQNLAQSIPKVYLTPPPENLQPVPYHADLESPHWVSRARWRPYMFAILSPVILPLLAVYTLVRGFRNWGQFVGEITEGVLE